MAVVHQESDAELTTEAPLDCTVAVVGLFNSRDCGEVDPERRQRAPIEQYQQRLEAVAARHGGVALGVRDNGLLALRFPCPDDALAAACDVYDVFGGSLAVSHEQVCYRIGIHHGAVVPVSDILGSEVCEGARRVMGTAESARILVSEDAAKRLSPGLSDRVFECSSRLELAEGAEAALFEVGCETDKLAKIEDIFVSEAATASTLQLIWGRQEWAVDPEHPVIRIGRGNQCDIVVRDSMASRFHARIEYRQGRFVLVDQSTNGTFVRLQDGRVLYVKHQELPLWGTGEISFGEAVRDNVFLLQFRCE